MKNFRINEKGRQSISDWLAANCTSAQSIDPWCADAEESLYAGNGAHIELPARHSVTRAPITFVVPEDGIDFFESSED